MLAFLIALTTEEEIETRSGRAGPSFSVRPEKEAKGAVSHGTSAAAKLSHDPTRSANLPKLNASRRFKHMGRFVFALRAKIPSRATQNSCCGRCLGLPTAPSGAGCENGQKPCFFVRFFQTLSTSWHGIRRQCEFRFILFAEGRRTSEPSPPGFPAPRFRTIYRRYCKARR